LSGTTRCPGHRLLQKTDHDMSTTEDKSPMSRTVVRRDGAGPVAPYNPGIIAGRLLYTAGCVGIDYSKNALVPGGIEPETRQAMTNLGAILTKAGSDFDKVVKITILLADIADRAAVNDIYKTYFRDRTYYPSRTVYQAAALPLEARIEIEAVAIVGEVQHQKEIHE